jgi:hypothetical protein
MYSLIFMKTGNINLIIKGHNQVSCMLCQTILLLAIVKNVQEILFTYICSLLVSLCVLCVYAVICNYEVWVPFMFR